MAVKHAVFPRKQYKLFVSDTTIQELSYVSITFLNDPGEAMGQGTVQHIEISPDSGFTLYLSSIVMNDVRFSYEIINPEDRGYIAGDTIYDNLNLSGTLTVSGDLYVFGTEYVTKTEILSGDQIIDGNLFVNGDSYLGDYLEDNTFVTGTIFGSVTGENATVFYDNDGSRLMSETVNDAIDELDTITQETSGELRAYIDVQDASVLSQSITYTDVASADLLSRIQSQNELSEILANGNDANGIIITNSPAPSANSDVANKYYVDNSIPTLQAVTTVGSVTTDSISASSFIGDGSLLTGISYPIPNIINVNPNEIELAGERYQTIKWVSFYL